MELRPELLPPALDPGKVVRFTALAARLDGAYPGLWEDALAEFNRESGTAFLIEDFQGIYGGEDHDDWVRRVLIEQAVRPVADVTRQELVEVVRRAMPQNGYDEHEAYMAIFDANVPLDGASNLIFYPPDHDQATNVGDEGRPIRDYNPTPEQIVEWALSAKG